MGNNITTLPERQIADDHSSSASTVTGNRLNNTDQRSASSIGSSIVSFSFRRTGKTHFRIAYGILFVNHIVLTVFHRLREIGLLGLSKTELDERCKPSGLYERCVL
jgi:hypothetical protein